MSDPAEKLAEIDGRHSQLLMQLDELNDRIVAALAEHSVRGEQSCR